MMRNAWRQLRAIGHRVVRRSTRAHKRFGNAALTLVAVAAFAVAVRLF